MEQIACEKSQEIMRCEKLERLLDSNDSMGRRQAKVIVHDNVDLTTNLEEIGVGRAPAYQYRG